MLLGVAFILLITGCSRTTTNNIDTATTTRSVTSITTDFDVQGHRGARGLQPENTLPAFETALDLGVSTLEFDLHFTADEGVVVWHDAVVDPAKCGLSSEAPEDLPDPDDPATSSNELMIRALTSEQLGWYQCDRNPDTSKYPEQSTEPTAVATGDYSIVTLVQLLEFVEAYAQSPTKTDEQRERASSVRFNMETKRKPKHPENIDDGFDGIQAGPFELRVLNIITERGLKDRVIIQSFDYRSLWAVHLHDPAISLSALSKGESVNFDRIAERGASIWSSDYRDLTASNLAAAHSAGLEVIPWTVNEPDTMARLVSMGVDGLISDRPDLLLVGVSPGDS